MGKAVVCALIIALGIGGWFLFLHQGKPAESKILTEISVSATSTSADSGLPPAREIPKGMKEYRSLTYRFSLLYPENFIVKEFKDPGTELTVTFTDPSSGNVFQIFIVPYGDTQISGERFKIDEPSGVRNEPTEITLDGVKAMSFFGSNTAMGETREVWFIHHGFLFEVTTYKEQDAWLSGIMANWKFL